MNNKVLTYKDSCVAFFCAIFVPGIVVALFSAICKGFNIDNTVYYYIALALSQLSLFAIFFSIIKFKSINYKENCKINFKLSIIQIILIILCGLTALFSFSPLVNLIQTGLQSAGYPIDQAFQLNLSNFGMLVINIIILGILPAICEELIFRGIILNGFRKYNTIVAILLSSLLFMLMHMSIEQSIYQFVLGIALSSVVVITGSLMASVILHAVNNIIVLVVNYISIINNIESSTLKVTNALQVILPILIAIIGMLLVFTFLKLLKKVSAKKENKEIDIKNENKEDITNNETIDKTLMDKLSKTQPEKDDEELKREQLKEKFQLISTFVIAGILWVLSVIITWLG